MLSGELGGETQSGANHYDDVVNDKVCSASKCVPKLTETRGGACA